MAAQRWLGLALMVACSSAPAPQQSVVLRAQQFGVLDSARVDSLCADPDSVRAGRKACVLRDQSRPLGPKPGVPPAAPPEEHR